MHAGAREQSNAYDRAMVVGVCVSCSELFEDTRSCPRYRIGFVLLSASGLAILGIMIAITLGRDRAWVVVGRVRSRMLAWD